MVEDHIYFSSTIPKLFANSAKEASLAQSLSQSDYLLSQSVNFYFLVPLLKKSYGPILAYILLIEFDTSFATCYNFHSLAMHR